MKCKAVAIITARGGSKRIPRKNIKEFCGKPIIAYSIEAALQAGIFDEVMVSTDDEEIAAVALQYGAKVPFYRGAATANDFSTTADVLREVLEEYKKRDYTFDNFCCIYPTAPFLTAEKLITGMKLLENTDGVLPVVKFSFPPQRCVVIKNGKVEMKWKENMNVRSQDLEPFYHDCGQFYCCRTKAFLTEGKLILDNMSPMIMDEREVQDIDNIEDWKIAEIKYRLMVEKEREKAYEDKK